LSVLLLAGLLISSLLLAYYSRRKQPMQADKPLDVDDDLPLPEFGQASTVFSLSALFGAYFGIAIVLGLPALTGLAFGTVLGLFLVHYWIGRYKPDRFETFLSRLLEGNERNAAVYFLMISAVQCVYATSELLILRELAKAALGLKSEHATVVAIGVAIIGYFYVLLGGYLALFRTDVLQFVLVGLLAVASGVALLIRGLPAGWAGRLLPRAGYWELPLVGTGAGLYAYHFIIAAVMGLGLLVASPDTWKRVYQVSRRDITPRARALIFVGVGVMPYVVLLPFAITVGLLAEGGALRRSLMFSAPSPGNLLFVAAASGLIASFLSAFNSALLASVHLGLMLARKKMGRDETSVGREISRFYWLMSAALLAIFFLFKALPSLTNNAYLLSNFLLGPYALIAGVQIGTRGAASRLPEHSLLLLFAFGIAGWSVYFESARRGLPDAPSLSMVNMVPPGVFLFLIVALLCQLLIIGGRKNVRHIPTDSGVPEGKN
jgi:hypothetical protein